MQELTPPDNNSINVPWSMLDMALGVGALVLSFVVFLLVLHPLVTTEDEGLRVFQLVLLGSAIEGAPAYMVYRLAIKRYGVARDALGFRRPRTRRNVLLVLGTVIGSLILISMYGALVTQLEIDILIPEPIPEELRGNGIMRRALTAIAIAGFVPFVEEIFFRGFLFQGLASKYGMIWGAALSSALFALAHIVIGTMIPIFLIGLLFSLLYARTGSLWMPISAHATFNLVGLSVSGA